MHMHSESHAGDAEGIDCRYIVFFNHEFHVRLTKNELISSVMFAEFAGMEA